MRSLVRVAFGLLLVAIVISSAVVWYLSRDPLPPEIRIAAGQPDGLYSSFAEAFAKRLSARTGRPVRVLTSVGSEANIELLRNGQAELALVQTASLPPEGLASIAPVFQEPLHLIARKGKGIRSPSDLKGRRVALGLSGSSIRINAQTVLAHYEIPLEDLQFAEEPFGALDTNQEIDAAVVTTGWMNPIVDKLLHRPDLELVSIPDPEGLSLRYPWFTPTTIPRGLYPGNRPVPSEPIRTISVSALLSVRSDASDRLVQESLAALYESDLLSEFPAVPTAKNARQTDLVGQHPAVLVYHDPAVAFKRLTQTMELLSKSKEALFGLGAAAILAWGWLRRRRERFAAQADRLQKQKLDAFIAQTLTVELDQMSVTEPEKLRPYLRQLTLIKQNALKELTSETVRGDQLFAIFLSQCAALSEKIQMRMIYGQLTEYRNSETAVSPRPSPRTDDPGGA